MFKYTSYLLVIILVACSSELKDIDFQELSINAVKSELLDPDSFELIKYSLDTTYLHEEMMRLISNDSMEISSAKGGLDIWESSKNDFGKDSYDEYLVQLKEAELRIDSSFSVINNTTDSIVGYRSFIRYYANSKGGMRVINQMGVAFDYKGLVVNTIDLD